MTRTIRPASSEQARIALRLRGGLDEPARSGAIPPRCARTDARAPQEEGGMLHRSHRHWLTAALVLAAGTAYASRSNAEGSITDTTGATDHSVVVNNFGLRVFAVTP